MPSADEVRQHLCGDVPGRTGVFAAHRDRKVLAGEVIGQFLHLRRIGAARVQHGPAVPVDGARVLAVEGDNVAAPAVGIIEVQVGERLPAAAQPDDLDIVLAAAVDNGFYHRVEAGDVATAGEDTDAFLRHDDPLLHSHGLHGPLALAFPKPCSWGAAWRGSRCQLFHQSRLAAVANDPGALPKDDCHFRPAPKRRLVGCIGK